MFEQVWIEEFALLIGCLALVAVVGTRLRLPLTPLYLLAGLGFGVAAGAQFESGSIRLMAEWGALVLLFCAGLRVDIKILRRTLTPALLGFLLQMILLCLILLQVGALLEWSPGETMMLTVIFGISSGRLGMALLRERGEDRHLEGQLVSATTIAEILLGTALLVAWAAMRSAAIPGLDHPVLTGLGLLFLVILLFFVGRLIFSRISSGERAPTSGTWLLPLALGTALGVAWLAGRFEFAVPLGALLAGAVFSQTSLSDELIRLLEPLRFLFGAIFFAVAGMQVELSLLPGQALTIIVLTVLLMAAKGVGCWLGFFLTGKPSWVSFQGSVAKSQVGEFAVVLAVIGAGAGILSSHSLLLVVAMTALSMLLSRSAMAGSRAVYERLAGWMPRPVILYGKIYHRVLHHVAKQMDRNRLWRLLRRPLLQIAFYSVILGGILLAAALAAEIADRLKLASSVPIGTRLLIWVASGLACLPFLISIMRNLNVVVLMFLETGMRKEAYRQLFGGRLAPAIRLTLTALVVLPMMTLFFALAALSLPSGWGLAAFAVALVVAAAVMWKQMIRINSRIEYVFMESLNEETQSHDAARRHAVLNEINKEYPWPVTVSALEVPEAWAGKRLREIPIRSKTGATVVALGRDDHIAFDPGPDSPLFPYDRLYLFGQEKEIEAAQALLREVPQTDGERYDGTALDIQTILLNGESTVVGDTLSGADLRRRFGVNVLGIQRGKLRITAPPADEILCEGDVLYVIGNSASIEALNENREADSGREA